MTLVVANRAGNDLARLQAAEKLGVALVEADVRLWRDRLEVRHSATVLRSFSSDRRDMNAAGVAANAYLPARGERR